MGCRFSRTSDTELEPDSDLTDLIPDTATRPLLRTTEYLFNSQSILKSDTTKALNSIVLTNKGSIGGDNGGDGEMIITPIHCIKNVYSLARLDKSFRSTFCNRIMHKPK